jgi:hypothetical protein
VKKDADIRASFWTERRLYDVLTRPHQRTHRHDVHRDPRHICGIRFCGTGSPWRNPGVQNSEGERLCLNELHAHKRLRLASPHAVIRCSCGRAAGQKRNLVAVGLRRLRKSAGAAASLRTAGWTTPSVKGGRGERSARRKTAVHSTAVRSAGRVLGVWLGSINLPRRKLALPRLDAGRVTSKLASALSVARSMDRRTSDSRFCMTSPSRDPCPLVNEGPNLNGYPGRFTLLSEMPRLLENDMSGDWGRPSRVWKGGFTRARDSLNSCRCNAV